MYFVKTPKLFTKIFTDVMWECPADKPEFHLTFDDGPSVNTGYILDFLAEHDLKASFFCLGRQIEKFPETFNRIKIEGHVVGNHGYAHLDGWKTDFDSYIEDVEKAQQLNDFHFFRPPFGRLSHSQYKRIKETYQIVMWSLMPGDFDPTVSIQKCQTRLAKADQTDIVVLHDHPKSDIIDLLKTFYT